MCNSCGKFRWSLDGPVSQIHSPHLLVGAPEIFSDLFRSVQMLRERERERVGWGKQREATAPLKSPVKLQPWFLSLRWKTCLRQNCSLFFSACSEGFAFGQNTLMMMMMIPQKNQDPLKRLLPDDSVRALALATRYPSNKISFSFLTVFRYLLMNQLSYYPQEARWILFQIQYSQNNF